MPLQKGKFYKQFKKNGFEHNYEILGEIFNNSTATGKLSHASTQNPPTSDEERELEEDFLSTGVHVQAHIIDIEGDSKEHKRKNKAIESSSERRGKELKTSKFDRLEACLEQWTKTMNARTELAMAKAKQYEMQDNTNDPYSIDACMELLDSMEDIPNEIYNKALEKFKDGDWRRMFIKMPMFRKKDWLASL